MPGKTTVPVAGAIAGLLGGCLESGVFVCASDDQCTPGICGQQGRCAFEDDDCPSGYRYGELSGSVSGVCTMPAGGSTGPGTTSDSGPVPDCFPAGRTARGVVALYGFCEGQGQRVADRSGVDPPLDLTFDHPGYAWVSAPAGLRSPGGDAIVASAAPATKVLDQCTASQELTLEVWVAPAFADQVGPGRVLALANTMGSNAMLGQGLSTGEDAVGWGARLRTSETPVNGVPTVGPPGLTAVTPTHVVFARGSDGTEAMYVDGAAVYTGTRLGDFGNWDQAAVLTSTNAPARDRPWVGVIHLAAVYCAALGADEVQQNFEAGFEVLP